MSKFVVLVIDSFGVGEMADVVNVRPQDVGCNTCGHILETNPSIKLPNLHQLGLINALGFEVAGYTYQANANYGTSDLMHEGGDTFMGHQEILGTLPKKPLRVAFSTVKDKVATALINKGYQVEYRSIKTNASSSNQPAYLWVNDCVAIGDNLEADLGQVYNVTANLSLIAFEEVVKIGRIVRSQVQVDRVITFGGLITSNEHIHSAAEVKNDLYIGINAPKSGAYDKGFEVVHLGYGVDATEQVPFMLNQVGIQTTLIGKVADIVDNPTGKNFENLVDTTTIMQLTLEAINQPGSQFICTNVQETDLAGHAQNVMRYSQVLEIVDEYLGKILSQLTEHDYLIVMADHGNDPTIGHSKHTREKVPLLIYKKGITGRHVGHRTTMSDVGATVCDYFNAPSPANGISFLNLLNRG